MLLRLVLTLQLVTLAIGCDDLDTTLDGGNADARSSDVEAGIAEVDSEVPDTDAGLGEADAGLAEADAGLAEADAGLAEADAGTPLAPLTINLEFDPRQVDPNFGPAHELSESNKAVFRAAALYWESQIIGYSDGVGRTVTINVGGVSGGLSGSSYYTNGASLNALGRARATFRGPRRLASSLSGGTIWVRLNPPASDVGPSGYLDGNPIFTTDEFKNLSQNIPQLVARHEMGHLLMNSSVIRASGNRGRLFDVVDDSRYVGVHGLSAYRAEAEASAPYVPFNGSDYSHFPASFGVLLSAGAMSTRLGDTTLGVLRDLGFATVPLVNPAGDLLL